MTTQTQHAGPDEQAELIIRFESAAHRKGELWERCQGKHWPAAESTEFFKLRDETIPALRAALLAEDKGGEVVAKRQYDTAMRQWESWKTYALELQAKLVKYEGGSPMILSTHPQQQADSKAGGEVFGWFMRLGTYAPVFLEQSNPPHPFTFEEAVAEGWRPLYIHPQQQAAQAAVPQGWKLAKVPVDTPDDDWGEPIVYDTNEIDQITHALTGDEGEDDSVTVLHRFVAHMKAVYPGKNMTQVLIETEEQRLSAAPVAAPEQAAQAAVPQWQPISTAPKDMAARIYRVNGYAIQGFVDAAGIYNVQNERGEWRKMRGIPTYWMPLPAAPVSAPEPPCNYPDCKCPTETPCLQGRAAPVEQKGEA